jgi:K+-sensing histidine kinase KdpD
MSTFSSSGHDRQALLRSLHHALLSPLGAIHNLADLLLLDLERGAVASGRRDAQDIADAADRLQHMLTAVLAYLGAVSAPLDISVVSLEHIIRDTVQRVGDELGVAAKGLQVRVPNEGLHIEVDADAVRAIVGRMIRHALHFAESPPKAVMVDTVSDGVIVGVVEGEAEVGTGQPSSAGLPEPLLKGTWGVDVCLCSHLAERLGGAFQVGRTSDGSLWLRLYLPRQVPRNPFLKTSPEK